MTYAPGGLLLPLPPAEHPFEQVKMNLVVSLPTITAGYDAVFIVVDKFSKLGNKRSCTLFLDKY